MYHDGQTPLYDRITDLRERTTRVEAGQGHLTDRVNAHSGRLQHAQEAIGRLSARLTEVERSALDARHAMVASQQALTRLAEQDRRTTDLMVAKEKARENRKQAINILYSLVILASAAAYLLGLIDLEKFKVVQGLRSELSPSISAPAPGR